MHNRATMLRCISLPSAAIAVVSLSACGASYPLQPAGEEWPREATVAARHVVSARTGEVANLELRVVDEDVLLSWTDRQGSGAAASTDGGRTLAGSAPTAAIGNARVTTEAELPVTRLREHTWLVTPGAHAFFDVTWTAEIPDVANRPVAIQEFCGLVTVVALERSRSDQRLVLRRYLPPRRHGTQRAQPIGLPIAVGSVHPRENMVIAAALVESALLAWADADAVNLVRVELPDVLCAGMAPRPRS